MRLRNAPDDSGDPGRLRHGRPGADAHHLRAADVQRNGDRGSEKFTAGSGNSRDITSSTWYPGDEWKGDVARMMMYMYLRYGNRCLPKNVGVGTAVASDTNMVCSFLIISNIMVLYKKFLRARFLQYGM